MLNMPCANTLLQVPFDGINTSGGINLLFLVTENC